MKPFHAHDKAAATRVVGSFKPKPGIFKSAWMLAWSRAVKRRGLRRVS